MVAGQQIRSLLLAGAGTIIVPTVPNIGATPLLMEKVISTALGNTAAATADIALRSIPMTDMASRTQAIHQAITIAAQSVGAAGAAAPLIAAYDTQYAQATQLTNTYNQAVDSNLATLGGNIVRVDTNALFSEVMAHPALYGITNTAGMVCPPGVPAATCVSSLPYFDTNSAHSYLFSDHFHPTPAIHSLIAEYMLSVLNAPLQAVALNQATMAAARDSQATLDGRLQSLRVNGNPVGSWGVFGGYAGQHYDYSGNILPSNGDAVTHNLSVGADYQVKENWLVGGLLSGSDNSQNPLSSYSYKTYGMMLSLFTQVNLNPQTWINADVHYGKLNFDDIQRTIMLGDATRTENGSTHGRQVGARMTAGWDYPVNHWLTTGPMAQLAIDYSMVSGYSEQGNDSTAMRFNDQVYHSQIAALGWRVDTHLGIVNPYAQVTYNHQFGDAVYRAGGGLVSTATSFTRDSATQDKDWANFVLGANLPLSTTVSAFAGVSHTAGLSSGQEFMYNAGVSARF